jgi:transposase
MDATRHAEYELAELKRRFAEAEARWSRERDTLVKERDELARLKAHLLALLSKHVRARFGTLSEKLSLEQMTLFAQVLEKEAAAAAAESSTLDGGDGSILVGAHRRKKKGRGAIPENLPRETTVHDLPQERKVCPNCHEALVSLDAPVRTERLEFVPARLKVLVELRPTYVCPCGCGHMARADLPPRAVEKCKAAPGLLAAVAVSKFGDHQPLYRQEGIFHRSGVEIGRSTMCDWMRQVGEAVEPLVELIRAKVRGSAIIQSDDTPVNVLDPGRGKTRQGRFWVYLGNGPDPGHPHPPHRCSYAAFDFSLTREGRWAREWLEGFAGFLQVDAFAGYDALFKEGRVTEVGCWAHARRHFFDAREFDKERCDRVLGLIGKLYAVERQAALLNASREGDDAAGCRKHRAERRRTYALPVLEELKAYLEAQAASGTVLPKSGMGQAVEYTLRNWRALTRYVEPGPMEGKLEIDNNASERAVKAVALGRKNWMFIGHELAGPTAARLMTLIASARLHEIEPWAYLKDVLERIAVLKTPADLEPLLPDRWKAAHPQHHLALGR